MSQHYSNPKRANDKWSLPNIEVFELTAREVAERNEDTIYEYMKRHEFRLASMCSQVWEKMFDAMIEEEGIEGGFFYWYCLPGCMPDSEPMGPYKTRQEAIKAAQEDATESFCEDDKELMCPICGGTDIPCKDCP